ncbi:MAG: asparagine synthase (glutamine-hydrolyzing) [Phototrophicaceae bacterium]
MCGICGTLNTHQPAEQHILDAMCTAMLHRGPDEDGFFVDGTIGLGMRRLKIIDLASGKQPIANEDQSVQVVYNGEIYNYLTLRQQLLPYHDFSTQSDTETLVHGYEQWGVAMLERLNGMFTFALWDARQQRAILARDPSGQKPLYYYHAPDGSLIFASEIKVLLESGRVPRPLNPHAIYHYLSTQYVMGHETILEGVYQLPAGHYLIWQGGKLTLERYWQPTYEPKYQHDERTWIEQTRQTVTEAVQRHMISDVPLGAYLSGGVDSSVIVGVMSQLQTDPVRTFSIGFDVASYSETSHARRIAERFHTDHHEFIVSAQDVTQVLERAVWAADQPLADTSIMATYLLAQLTRQHVTVALTGDGGDEAFAGYTRYVLDRALAWYRRVPAPVRQVWIPNLAQRLPSRSDIPTDRNILQGIKRLGTASATSPKASILAWGSFFDEEQKRALCHPDWVNSFQPTSTASRLGAVYDRAIARTHLDRTLATDFELYLQDDLLVKADRMAMAHSLETRAPFLDTDVLALSLRMPAGLRIRGGVQKYALRQAFRDVLPSENVNRIKRGFGMPIGSWLRGHLRPLTHEVLTDPSLYARGWFVRAYVEQLLDEHQAGREDHGQRLWALLVLALWLRQFETV